MEVIGSPALDLLENEFITLFLDHEINNFTKEVCFWLCGKDNCGEGAAKSAAGERVWRRAVTRALRIGAYGFINKAQFNAGFTDRLKLKDGAVRAIMIPVMSRNRRW
ncbi:hypothetical protein DPX16_9846 [Anabarilius grahami]|uniref:Uncharacterized protein n=1 Tax=Anabarilius grahami TaxID=495550 RepID=A0A3N0Y3S1_ANAGA|nr:hypothetical protein DPX16_9846 [Anabarilius grahami]